MTPATSATDAKLNELARRSFRDTADQDYIAARLAYRAELIPQFLWAGLQAVEKYLKGILLFNRIPAKKVGHDLGKALKLCESLPFDLRLTQGTREFIEYLDRFGRFRYLENSYYIQGPGLVQLDRAVWELRRYCRSINYSLRDSSGSELHMLPVHLAEIEQAEKEGYHKFQILGGRLEKIIRARSHPARDGLVWKNLFFGLRQRATVSMRVPMQSANAPLWLHPEILDEALKYIFIPRELVGAFRDEAEKRKSAA